MENIANGPGVTVEQQIRWGDMDARGHVNNIVFFQFAESARVAYFGALGINRGDGDTHEGMILAKADMNFRRQLHYPGKVLVSANATKISRRSMILSYVLRDAADGTVVGEGDSVMVWIDYATGQAAPIPDSVAEAVARLEQNDELLAGRAT